MRRRHGRDLFERSLHRPRSARIIRRKCGGDRALCFPRQTHERKNTDEMRKSVDLQYMVFRVGVRILRNSEQRPEISLHPAQ